MRSRLWAVVASALLVGCVPAQTVPVRYYALSPAIEGSEEPAAAHPSLAVASVTIPAYLDRTAIVRFESPNRLRVYESDNWLEPPLQAIARVLGEDLRRLLGIREVYLPEHRFPEDLDWRLEVEIFEFRLGPGDHVLLDAQWRLIAAERRRRLAGGRERIALPVEAPGDLEAAAAAMSRALGELARRIAEAAPTGARSELAGRPRTA